MISFQKSLVLALFVISIYASAASAKPSTPADKATKAVGSMAISAPKKLGPQGTSIDKADPQGNVASGYSGIMEPGTVRPPVNYEPLVNRLGILALMLGHVVGVYYLIKTARLTVKTPGKILAGTAKGLTFISVGLLTPGLLHWALAAARDAALLN